MMQSQGVDFEDLSTMAEAERAQGQTVMLVAINGKAAGLVGVADPIKQSTPEAIGDLHAEGVKIVMLTGDNLTTAKAVADQLDIDRIEAEVSPDQKRKSSKNCSRKAVSSQWPEMASTMPRHWRRRMSVSPWVPVPMSRWKAPVLPWSGETCAASSARAA
jgi:hypothetical protein